MKKLFEKMATNSLRRSISKNGKALTRELAEQFEPENEELKEVWEKVKARVLR